MRKLIAFLACLLGAGVMVWRLSTLRVASGTGGTSGRDVSGGTPQPRPLSFAGHKPPTPAQKKAGESVVSAANEFAFRISAEVSRQAGGGGFLVSPISVQTCHAMLLPGARGATHDGLASALCLSGLGRAQIADGLFALAYGATRAGKHEFQLANALFEVGENEIEPQYEEALKAGYDAKVIPLPDAGPKGLGIVNGWVAEETGGAIRHMLDQIDPKSVMLLGNVATFQGKWRAPFDESATREEPFHLASGASVKVPMMHREAETAGYASIDGLTFLQIPYAGGAFSFVVVLPPRGVGPAAVLSKLTPEKWRAALAKAAAPVQPVIPKLEFRGWYDLKPVIRSMGGGLIFGGGDLSGISADLWVTLDVHATHVKVDEKGTRAEAATLMDMPKCDEPRTPAIVRVDRPFVYAIVQRGSGLITFLGVCMDPRSTH